MCVCVFHFNLSHTVTHAVIRTGTRKRMFALLCDALLPDALQLFDTVIHMAIHTQDVLAAFDHLSKEPCLLYP